MSGSNGMLMAEELEQIMGVSENFIAKPIKESIENMVKSMDKLNEKLDRLYAVSEQQWNAVCKQDSSIKHIAEDVDTLNEEVFVNIPKEKKEKRKWMIGTGISAGGLIVLLLQKFGVIK